MLTGPSRGWPDVDLIGGQWPTQQERFRLSFICISGSPLFLSWDVRNASASTLPLSAYLNPELIAIHQVCFLHDLCRFCVRAYVRLSCGNYPHLLRLFLRTTQRTQAYPGARFTSAALLVVQSRLLSALLQ